MLDLLVVLAYIVPTTLAVVFMLWVFWNLCLQFRKRR
jgi:hypothetical protein